MTPQFTHDCDWCIFIGRVERGSGIWRTGGWHGVNERDMTWPAGDLYVHPGGGLVIRTGNDGPDYSSMDDAYFAALPDEWKPMARSIWRNFTKRDEWHHEYTRKQIAKRRTRRRQDRRMTRRGLTPWMERMRALPDGFPDYYEDE